MFGSKITLIQLFAALNTLFTLPVLADSAHSDQQVLSINSIANSANSEQQLLQQLEAHAHGSTADTLAALPGLERIQTQAQRNGWLKAEIAASADIAYLYSLLENWEAAELALKQFQRFDPKDVDMDIRNNILSAHLFLVSTRQQHSKFTQLKLDTVKQLHVLEKAGELRLQAFLLLNLGNSMMRIGQYDEAIEPLKQASGLFQQLNDSDSFDYVKGALAQIHGEMDNHQLALALYLELLNEDLTAEKSIDNAMNLYNVGMAYNALKQYDQAGKYLRMSRELSVEIHDEVGIAFADLQLTLQLLNQERYQQAREQLKYPALVFTEQQHISQYLSTLRYQTEALIGVGELEQAAVTLLALQRTLADHDTNKTQSYHLLRYKLAQARQQPQAAIAAYKDYADIRVAGADSTRENSMQKLLAEFGAEQAVAEKRLLEQGNQLQQMQLDRAATDAAKLYLFGGLALLFVALIVLFWWRERTSRNRIQKLALQDFLTGAPNRRAVMEYAHKCLTMAIRHGQPLSLAIIDLDHFKQVNDNYGHDVGDRVLQQFSTICAEELRNEDQYGRFGGEEWLLVFPGTRVDNVSTIFERLRARLREVNIEGANDSQVFTFSMGAAQWNRDFSDLDELIKAADSNVYKAKQQGRDRLVMPQV